MRFFGFIAIFGIFAETVVLYECADATIFSFVCIGLRNDDCPIKSRVN